jgi:Tfp pilus assembly protein PilF
MCFFQAAMDSSSSQGFMAKKSRRNASLPLQQNPAPSAIRWIFSRSWLPWLLAAVTFLVYIPSLHSDFISDARKEIIDEGFVTSLSNLPTVVSLKVLRMHLMLSDRPGEMLYLMLNATLWGKNPFGYHLSSIVLHAGSVALLLMLLRRLAEAEMESAGTGSWKIQLALVAATLVFALHPIATESVAEVSFSSSLLVTFFTLLGLLAATAFRPDDRKKALLAGIVGTLCAFGATLTKESGIAVALLLVVYWFFFRRREAKRPWFVFLGAALAVTAAVVGTIFLFVASHQLDLDYLGGSFGQVFLIQPRLWIFMMGQVLWPTRLVADYTLVDMNLLSTPCALVVLAVVVALQVWLACHSRIGALGVATWWLGLATVSNFIPLYCFLADRFYYLPLAGAAMQLSAVFLLLLRSRRAYGLAVGAVLAAVPFLAGLTITRQAAFASEDALWTDTLKKSPHSYLARYSRGVNFIRQGRLEEAAEELDQAVANDTKDSTAYVCMGLIAQCRGEPEEAIARFQTALTLNPRNSEAHGDLGVALCQQSRFDEGIEQFQEALALDPDDDSVHADLGLAFAQTGRPELAVEQLRDALQVDPHSVQAHYALGNVLAQTGQPGLAAEQFRAVLQINPNHVEATTNLGVIDMHQGHFDQAIFQFQRALKLRPGSADIHDDLGVALAQKGDTAGAIAQFQEALRLKPGFESAQANLARAQAAAAPTPEETSAKSHF